MHELFFVGMHVATVRGRRYTHRNPPLYDSRHLSETLSDRVATTTRSVRNDASADSAVCTTSVKLVLYSPLCTPLPREMPTATFASSPWR
jgi:hypothetical protein